MNNISHPLSVLSRSGPLGFFMLLAALALLPPTAAAQPSPLVGAWTLTAADVIKPDGTRTQDYGPNPHGLAVFTAEGNCSVAIYRADRLKFASNDKRRGTPEE